MNRKHPVRDEWNSFGLQSEQYIDTATAEDEDICIKVSCDELMVAGIFLAQHS